MRAPVSHQAEYQAEFATRMQSCTRKLHQAEVALARTADSKSVVVTVAVTVTVATLEEDLAFQGTEATVEEMEWVAMVEVVAAGRGRQGGSHWRWRRRRGWDWWRWTWRRRWRW